MAVTKETSLILIFGKKFGTLTVISQKVYHGTDTDKHGARLDVYIEENATTDNLRSIHQMVNLIKQDEEVSLQYMKIFEREEMLIQQGIEQGIEQGRKEEQANTELERQRAEKEKARADQLEKELQQLKDKLKESMTK